MNKKIYTVTEFANACEITRQAVLKNIDSGLIPAVKNKGTWSIKIDDPAVRGYIDSLSGTGRKFTPLKETEKPVEVKDTKKPKSKKPVKVKAQKKSNIKDTVDPEDRIPDVLELPLYLKELSDSGELTLKQALSLPKNDLEKINVYEKIKSSRTKTEQIREGLIDRKLVRLVLGKMYEIDMNEFLTLKNKVVPDIAGIMGCTDPEKMLEAERRIDEEMHKILKHIKIEIDKFLKKVGEVGIENN